MYKSLLGKFFNLLTSLYKILILLRLIFFFLNLNFFQKIIFILLILYLRSNLLLKESIIDLPTKPLPPTIVKDWKLI